MKKQNNNTMKTKEVINGKDIDIEWELTGEVLSRDCGYTTNELILGFDDFGNEYEAVGTIDNGSIECIDEIEAL